MNSLHTMETDRAWFESELLDRFLRYVRIYTTSDRHSTSRPSTQRQIALCDLLAEELTALGVADVSRYPNGVIIARLPGRVAEGATEPGATAAGTRIGFMAHVDTAPDFTGKNVNPQVVRDYTGGPIALGTTGLSLSPDTYPMLNRYRGDTLITTDGSTLLGADDKAGIAEIMTALAWLIAHPEIPHAPLEIIFTTDEEIGKGMDGFPTEASLCRYCYTVDGGDEASIEAECFTAVHATVRFTGFAIHPGQARGKMVNPISMASAFVRMLPQAESPEATDGRFGFYCPVELEANLNDATLYLLIRDFEMSEVERRTAALHAIARAVEAAFPGGTVAVEAEEQYRNMRDIITQHPQVMELLEQALAATGVAAERHSIRGGTDGSRFTQMGVPTPNIFTGAQNMHSRFEWVGLGAMVRAAKTVVNLAQLWAGR